MFHFVTARKKESPMPSSAISAAHRQSVRPATAEPTGATTKKCSCLTAASPAMISAAMPDEFRFIAAAVALRDFTSGLDLIDMLLSFRT